MTGGEIAGIIAASAFMVLALAIAVPLVKIGKVMDEASKTVHQVTVEVVPLIAETRQTIKTGNDVASAVERIVATLTRTVDTVAGAVDSVAGFATSSKAKTSAMFFPLAKKAFAKYKDSL
jgi:uncharacterized protein YoxC